MPSKGRGRAKGGKTVRISLAYVAFLHDQLAVNQEKLKEILGSGAGVVSDYSSDKLVDVVSKKSSYGHVDRLAKTIKGWGMDLKQTWKGDTVQFEVGCPYAGYVHPRLSSEHPICPLSEYVLGEVRRVDRKATLENCALTERGSRFAVRLTPVESQFAAEPGETTEAPKADAKSKRSQ